MPGTSGGGVAAVAARVLEKALEVVTGVLVAGMTLIVFANVIARYFLSASIGWSEEVSRFLFIWVALLGSVLAFMRSEHLGLDILVKALPARLGKGLQILADALVLVALGFVVWGGVEMTADSFASGWVSSAVPIAYGWVYLVVPISAALMLLLGLARLVADIRGGPPQPAGSGEGAC